MSIHKKHMQGFTLVELIIALAIVAVLGMMATVGLRSVLQTREHLVKTNAHITQLMTTVSLLQQDTRAAIARTIINNDGHRVSALISLQPNGFMLTRQGVTKLQRVGYQVTNHQLVRLSWQRLDRAPGAKPTRQILLSNIKNWEVRFLLPQGGISQRWPLVSGSNVRVTNQTSEQPAAVFIKINFSNDRQLPLLLPLRGRGYHG